MWERENRELIELLRREKKNCRRKEGRKTNYRLTRALEIQRDSI